MIGRDALVITLANVAPFFFPFHPLCGRTPDSSPASSHAPRNLLETSLRRDLASLTSRKSQNDGSLVRIKERLQLRDLLRLHMPRLG